MTEATEKASRVVVVTRTKNRPVLLRRAMESVLSQGFENWTHVVVNDGGDPVPVDLLAVEYAARYRGRLKVIHHAKSLGMQNASNSALRATESEFATIHDDDDSWETTFLEKCVGYLTRQGVESSVQGVVAHTHWIFEEIDVHGNVVELWRKDFPVPETIKLSEVAGENRFPPIAFLYRRNAHEAVGLFSEQFGPLGDWDFNLRFLSRFDIGVVPEKLARWHWRHQGGGTAYGNTVTAGVAVHKEMEARMFNHYMRLDMDSGKPGLGHLMNVSQQIVQISRKVDEMRGRVEQAAGTASATLAQAEHLNRITRDLARLWEAKEWVRRSVAIVRERKAVTNVALPSGRNVRDELMRAVSRLAAGDVLSLDVFDTALLRVLRQPKDLFSFIEPDVRALLGKPEFPFAQARVAAERVARERHVAGTCEDVTLRQIYGVWAEVAGIAWADAVRAMELEQLAERHLCVGNPIVKEAAHAARQKGVRVVFVSDMYLTADVLRDLLVANGYESPEVYVSAEAGKTKHSGALFDEVLGKLGCSPERMLHVGDHPESDYRRPEGMGIRTLYVDRKEYGTPPLADQHAALAGTGRMEVLSSVFTGLARRRAVGAGAKDDIWERLGYELAGPMALAFARWIAQRVGEQGVQHLFFLARDGFLLEKAFRACSERWKLGVESTYMLSSRRVLNMARIDRLDDAAFHFLLTADPFLRVRDFLERIGLPAGALVDDVARVGLGGLDDVVTVQGGFFRTPELRESMRRLLAGQEARIMAVAAKEREKLLAYLGDIGFGPGPVAIVDLGWQASSIRSLQDLLRRAAPEARLRGYYFGTWAAAATAIEAECDIDSFFVHLGRPERRAGLLAECVELVEHLFTAPHPTVVGIERTGDKWNPLCGEWETTSEQRECLARTSRAAMVFVEDALKVETSLSLHATPFGYLESVMERVLRHPTRAEAKTLGALPHRDSFGGEAPWRHLAKVPSTAQAVFRPSSLREAYERSYWRKGFLAQLGPTERAMFFE